MSAGKLDNDVEGSEMFYSSYICNAIRGYASIRFEAQCVAILESRCPQFIQGIEAAVVDCGILELENNPTYDDRTHRFFSTLQEHQTKEILLPFDIKAVSPRLSRSHRGGLVFYSFHATINQFSDVAAYIVFSAMGPQLVALMPSYYLTKNKKGGRIFYGREIPLGQSVPSFPLEWMPFVMPMDFLPQAMNEVRRFRQGVQPFWTNPFNGVVFRTCPHPELRAIDMLRPTDGNRNHDYSVLSRLWKSLRQHSREYKLELLSLQPAVGDFLIRHIPSGATAVFELKSHALKLGANGQISHTSRQSGQDGHSRRFFTSTTMWDFLYSTTGTGETLITSRDDIPLEWFIRPSKITDDQLLNWTPPPGFLSRQLITKAPPTQSVRRFEQILNHYRESGRFRAKRQIPLPKSFVPEDDALDREDLDGDDESHSEKPKDRGTSRNWSPYLWQAEMEEQMLRACSSYGQGHFFRVGFNPSGTFVFVPGRRLPGETILFESLPLGTPMVYVNFGIIGLVDSRLPSDTRHPTLLRHATHGPSPSIYILVLGPQQDVWQPYDRFVVPSVALSTTALYDLNERGIVKNVRTCNPRKIRLKHEEMVDVYARQNHQVVAELCRIFQQPLGTSSLFMGDEKNKVGTQIQLGKQIVTKRLVLQESMDVWDGLTWLNRLRDDGPGEI